MPNSKQENLIKVKKNFQLTLPGKVRKSLNINEGDYVSAVIDKKGGIYIKPVKMIDHEQAYFWTDEWQKSEKEADNDIKNAKVSGPFKSSKEAIKHLNKL